MKITILTKPPRNFLNIISFYLIYWLKKAVKKILFIPDYGPSAVLESLIRGFKALKVNYQLNPKVQDISDIVCVISGVETLKWAIWAKKQGKIKKIIAGPIIVITPKEANGILLDKTIDLVIIPSLWVKDFYASFDRRQNDADIKQKDAEINQQTSASFKDKIRVWAAGVENSKEFQEKPRNGCLVYKKAIDKEFFDFVMRYLKSHNIVYEVIKYGRYKKEKYFEILNRVKFMLYLSESESQGLALHEAWIRNVPTFVWNRGYMQWNNYKWYDGRISAPYLTDECGMFFKDKGDFVNKFNIFIKNFSNFKPREYSLKNFTDEVSTKNYLEIVNSLYDPENTKARNYR